MSPTHSSPSVRLAVVYIGYGRRLEHFANCASPPARDCCLCFQSLRTEARKGALRTQRSKGALA